MKLSRVKALVGVCVTTLVSYSPAWAQLCDNPNNPACNGTGGGGGGGGGGDPQLVAPAVIALIAVGIVTAMVVARKK